MTGSSWNGPSPPMTSLVKEFSAESWKLIGNSSTFGTMLPYSKCRPRVCVKPCELKVKTLGNFLQHVQISRASIYDYEINIKIKNKKSWIRVMRLIWVNFIIVFKVQLRHAFLLGKRRSLCVFIILFTSITMFSGTNSTPWNIPCI